MSDTSTLWVPAQGGADWSLAGTQLHSGDDLRSAVLISLFTDRTANQDDVIPDGTGDPRGWWGDVDQTHPIGSRLWLLNRAKQTTETLNSARDYIAEALQWLIDDGVIGRFDIFVEWTSPGLLGARLVAHRPNGTQSAMQFSWTWTGIN